MADLELTIKIPDAKVARTLMGIAKARKKADDDPRTPEEFLEDEVLRLLEGLVFQAESSEAAEAARIATKKDLGLTIERNRRA